MPEIKDIFMKVTEALESADKGHKILTAKVASQAEEIRRLREQPVMADCSEAFKGLVEKLASVGVVEDLNAVYLKDNVTGSNASDFLVKLANCVEPKRSYTSPYEVSSIPVDTTVKKADDEALTNCNQKLQALYGK